MTAEQNTDDNIAEHRTPFSEHKRPFSEQPNKTAEQNTRSANAEQRSLPLLKRTRLEILEETPATAHAVQKNKCVPPMSSLLTRADG